MPQILPNIIAIVNKQTPWFVAIVFAKVEYLLHHRLTRMCVIAYFLQFQFLSISANQGQQVVLFHSTRVIPLNQQKERWTTQPILPLPTPTPTNLKPNSPAMTGIKFLASRPVVRLLQTLPTLLQTVVQQRVVQSTRRTVSATEDQER